MKVYLFCGMQPMWNLRVALWFCVTDRKVQEILLKKNHSKLSLLLLLEPEMKEMYNNMENVFLILFFI